MKNILDQCELIVNSYERRTDKTICKCSIAGKNGSSFTIEIGCTSFGFDWNRDGDLYILAFLSSYINKAQQRNLTWALLPEAASKAIGNSPSVGEQNIYKHLKKVA
jgi:hypothetical protein